MDSNSWISRRELLSRIGCAFGSFSVAGYFVSEGYAAAQEPTTGIQRTGSATSVIRIFADGGPSQVDTFDPKPRLGRENGNPVPFVLPQTSNKVPNRIFQSPYRFSQHGRSGLWASELFPHVAECVDDLTIIRSMCHTQNDHGVARCFTSTGHERSGRPSLGAWVLFGLGSRNEELPGFVALNEGDPQGDCLTCGFLPPAYLATGFRGGDCPIPDLQRREPSETTQASKLGLVQLLNRLEGERRGHNSLMTANDACRERAISMQRSVPELYDFGDETAATLELYGIPYTATENLGTQCLIARRLVERGVRFVQINHPGWDHHGGLRENIPKRAVESDRPIAGLLKDLKTRGLLDNTLVLWGGEFGRTPHGDNGREHNPFGYTVWLAGGGVKAGYVHGATDEFGYYAVQDKVSVHDLHATILHLLGIDHTRLVYRFGGREYRLTDVEGEVINAVIA